ncbi:MAG TPA: ATP-binding protein [Candidatus Acidoferrum sp.]|nr:ATP-binding protein [Candidatus Acidoferrum sp.]
MAETRQPNNPEINQAFLDGEREIWVRNFRIGCILGFIFVPAGFTLDLMVYPGHFLPFLKLRLLCSAMLLFIWWFVKTPVGLRIYRWLGLILPALPTLCFCLMIYESDGAESPYYAGLNLILLGAGLVLRWTFVDSLLAFLEVLGLYFAACLLHGPIENRNIFFNNIYFVFVTGVFVVIGSYFYNQLRFREFAFRFQLDKSKQELEETNHRLVELDRLKSRFFANVSHEMRTPLTLLIAPLETLVRRFEKSLDRNTHEMLQTMQNNGMRLLKLINDLLELIRLESGRLELKKEPVPVVDFIQGLASAVKQMATDKHINLETRIDEDLAGVLGDRDKLEKILLNLLFNALKFTPQHGRISLRAEKQENEFCLIVADTGIGIAQISLPFVFDRFWQEDGSSKRKFQGVGIGLALVKELTETMGGKVTVESQLGKGTTFTVRLPYEKAEFVPPAATAPAQATTDGEPAHSEEWLAHLYRRAEFFPTAATQQPEETSKLKRRTQRPLVLVADDEPDMRRFLVSQLEDDYDVVEAKDGNEASEKAQSILPDIILLDLMMPHKDGLQVCRELRDYSPTVAIPIILLTARADEEVKFNALQIGANDFLAKPFSSIELQARIKNLIESHHSRRKLTKQNEALSVAIDQIKETEMQLVQSEKLSSLGRMSAGIIHEINNPLNFSLTGLFALRNKGKKLPADERADYDAIVNDIEEGLKRVRNIVSDLRTFTHPGGGTGEPVEAGDVADAALRFLGGEWRDTITIHQEIPPALSLWANRNKLIHVLVNLLQNAIDAMREKKYSGEDKPQIRLTGKTENRRTVIVVRDNGPGIDPKISDKIFDPFFTTKEVGKGMGLGLSICYRIVKDYGGIISVESEPGQYCAFTLDFPADADAAAEMEIENGELVRL